MQTRARPRAARAAAISANARPRSVWRPPHLPTALRAKSSTACVVAPRPAGLATRATPPKRSTSSFPGAAAPRRPVPTPTTTAPMTARPRASTTARATATELVAFIGKAWPAPTTRAIAMWPRDAFAAALACASWMRSVSTAALSLASPGRATRPARWRLIAHLCTTAPRGRASPTSAYDFADTAHQRGDGVRREAWRRRALRRSG